MKILHHPSRGLGTRLFVSHFLVALVATFTLLTAIYLVAPKDGGRPMSEMMGSMPGMVGQGQMSGMMSEMMGSMSGMEGMVGSVVRAFGPTLLYSLLMAGVVAAVAAGLTSLSVSKRLVDPLRRVIAATRRVATGRYEERVPIGEADELGALSESFNSMAASLEDAERRRLELIGDVSHELRTPLSTLQGYMEGLMEGGVEPSEETWALLYGEAERMRRLVDDLRQLSHAEAGRLDLERTAVSPEGAVRTAVERMLPLFDEKGVELASAVSGDLPPASADGDRVVQVLTNLLANALRHTPSGGRVTVEAKAGEDAVAFRVGDTGEGIAPEHLPRVFERFYKAEKSRSREDGGSGLGLDISRALVEAMGGTIRAESPGPGRGANFTFTLPPSRR